MSGWIVGGMTQSFLTNRHSATLPRCLPSSPRTAELGIAGATAHANEEHRALLADAAAGRIAERSASDAHIFVVVDIQCAERSAVGKGAAHEQADAAIGV